MLLDFLAAVRFPARELPDRELLVREAAARDDFAAVLRPVDALRRPPAEPPLDFFAAVLRPVACERLLAPLPPDPLDDARRPLRFAALRLLPPPDAERDPVLRDDARPPLDAARLRPVEREPPDEPRDPRDEPRPRDFPLLPAALAVSRETILLKLLFCPPAVDSW